MDVSLHLDTRKAGFSDDIHDSVDYGSVCHFITKYMKEHTFRAFGGGGGAAGGRASAAAAEGWPGGSGDQKALGRPIGLPLTEVAVSVSRGWHTVYLSVGSNLGDRAGYLRFAYDRLSSIPYIRDVRISSLYETAPYGVTEQPPFLNAAVSLGTLYTPCELLDLLHAVEAEAGRERKVHWGAAYPGSGCAVL